MIDAETFAASQAELVKDLERIKAEYLEVKNSPIPDCPLACSRMAMQQDLRYVKILRLNNMIISKPSP